MSKPRLLDLFSGAGGAAKGYQRAGFYVVGVDNRPQPRYCGEEFIQADALEPAPPRPEVRVTPEEIAAAKAKLQAMLCRSENCDGARHRCSVCSGMGYICHVTHGTDCRFCDGRGAWPCPAKESA